MPLFAFAFDRDTFSRHASFPRYFPELVFSFFLSVVVVATMDLSVLSVISPESQDPAADAIIRARERVVIPDMPFWSMEDHLVAIAERVDHMAILGSDLPRAAIAAFRALWPGKEVPKSVADLCEWVGATEARLCEWRDSAGRIGIAKALQIVLSWYEGISLDSLGSIRADSEYYTDDAAKKRLEEAACKLLDFADVNGEFFEDVREAGESDEEAAGDGANTDEGGVSGGDPDDLLISEEARQMAPASDTATASDIAGPTAS